MTKKQGRRKEKFTEEMLDKILIHYAQRCVDRGYHPRYVSRRLLDFEDAYTGRWNV